MCGIFGVLYHKTEALPDKEQLTETARLLRHRGPDSDGIYADAGIGLVHTRLSLLDLTPRSNQPFWDRQGRYGLVYNGEIYNFKELREDLERRGVRFRTTSDTEVLLECLINDGVEETLPKLEGMFAFALYDKVEKILTVARDRFGIKPVFIYDQDDAFVFASEIQAMRPWIKFRPDSLSISSYLYGFGGPTKGRTFFEHISMLPPGAMVRIQMGKASEYRAFFTTADFWDPEQAALLRSLKPGQLIDKVEERLFESVRQQLIADAPVGALCSGGVDSALILAMAAKSHNNLAIFHANVVGPYSEYEAALGLARYLKLELKAVEVHDHDVIDLMPEVAWHYGNPFYIVPSCTPFLMVSRLVQSHEVKAVLTGEGSDECYLGYNFLVPNIRKWPRQAYSIVKRAVKRLIRGGGTISGSDTSEWDTHRSSPVPLDTQRLVMGLHNRFEVALETEDIFSRVRSTNGAAEYPKEMKSLDLLNYNLRALLNRNDLMGMAASVESRFPFLDSQLVKMAVNMPYECKIRFSVTALDSNHYFFRDKWIIRKVAERYLPREICTRPKGKFRVDAFQQFTISPHLFNKSFVSELFGLSSSETRYLAEKASKDLRLKLMHLETWSRVCLNNEPKDTMVRKLRDHVMPGPNAKPALSVISS